MNYKKISLILSFALFSVGFINAAYYEPNSDIQGYLDDVNAKFISIASSMKVNQELPVNIFSALENNFQVLKNELPQKNEFKIVYENCILTSKKMQDRSNDSYKTDLSVFNSQCFGPWKDISRELYSRYAVDAKISVSPKSGNAPLTVTFDGNASRDPSADTIPSDNYYWYYKDSNGIQRLIGRGAVVQHTFTKENDYVVHLTTRSVNRKSEGILDGSTNVTISVAPPIANISMYIEGQKADVNSYVKVSESEGKRGILFDASGTTPRGGTTIVRSIWNIEKDGKSIFIRDIPDDPKSVRVKLPENGYYFATLTLEDNTGKTVTKRYKVTVSNPVGLIKVQPESGITSDTFKIDGSPSYSVNGKITSYKWTIVGPNGSKIDSFSAKKFFTYNFNTPGIYAIKLEIEDVNGNRNEETYKLEVASTPPVANFIYEKYDNREKPSTFIFDASYSSDVDEKYGDTLSYNWTFSNPKDVKTQYVNNGQKMIVQFNKIGKYTVTLNVKDKYGATSSIEKEINIMSTLRPEVSINPNYVTIGQPVGIRVNTNKTVAYYEYFFGDKKNAKTQSQFMEHTYMKAGVYDLIVKVSSTDGDSNSILKKVFVGQKGYPIAIYDVYKGNNKQQLPSTYCMVKKQVGTGTVPVPAFEVPRLEEFTLDAKDSINGQGNKNMLSIYFRENEESQNILQPSVNLKFDELGCQKMTLYVKSLENNKLDKKDVYFKVINARPVLKGLSMFFPQYGGNQENSAFTPRIGNNQLPKNIFQAGFDPLLIKLIANGAYDPDSPTISYYRWYYYKQGDRANLVDVKASPYNIPQMVFSLPRIPGVYIFGVDVCDEDGECTNSEDHLKVQPRVNIPPSVENPDIPQVNSVRIDTEKVKGVGESDVGQTLTINVNSDILSKKDDFLSSRTIKYDFDNDGKYDLTTKSDKVTHVYDKPGKYKVKVKVIYRGYGGIGYSAPIIIKKGLKPVIDLNFSGDTLIFNDLSYGNIKEKLFCFDFKGCKTQPADYLIKTKDYGFIKYTDIGQKFLLFQVKDDYGNEKTIKEKIEITDSLTGSWLLSLPKSTQNQSGYNIVSAGAYKDYVIWYYKSSNKECYVDRNINVDTDGDGNTTNDKDFLCNEAYKLVYENTPEVSLLINDGSEKILTKIQFPDFSLSLPQEYKQQYEAIQSIIDKISSDENQAYLLKLLSNLISNLDDKIDRDSILLELDSYIKSHTVDSQIKTEIEAVISSLSDYSTNAAINNDSNEISRLKSDIEFFLLNDSNKQQIDEIFAKLNEATTKEERKQYLQEILNIGIEMKGAGAIDDEQLQIIKSSICDVLNHYEIQTQACGTEVKNDVQVEESDGSTLGNIIKIVLRVLAILVGIFIMIVVVFVIKAKMNKEPDEPEQE